MSNELVTKSKGASVPTESDSVFDFLYHDPQRIASFLGQFDPSGVAQSLKKTDQVSRTSSDYADDGIKINAGIVSGQVGARTTVGDSVQNGAEKTYDPLWTNARAFLDYLAAKSMIQRDVYAATIGQFVLITGSLSIIDIAMLKEGWKLPTFRHAAGIAPSAPRSGKARSTSPEPNPIEFAFEMLGILPHSVQALVTSPNASVWSIVRSDCLATSSGDLLLKHGLKIPGDWSILGILDAQPDLIDSDGEPEFSPDGDQMAAQMMAMFAPLTRKLLGRPQDSFGITPLLIFREARG